jgi:hypothetical protein
MIRFENYWKTEYHRRIFYPRYQHLSNLTLSRKVHRHEFVGGSRDDPKGLRDERIKIDHSWLDRKGK